MELTSECIEWTGPKWSQGRYGMDRIDGKSMGAHRAAWIRTNGPIPEGMVVCHKCDNGLCVNVDHLFLGSLKDNMQDCVRKGRLRTNLGCQKGGMNRNAGPGIDARDMAIKLDIAAGMTWSAVREMYGIKSNGHLAKILRREI